jgi:hypothetical protein
MLGPICLGQGEVEVIDPVHDYAELMQDLSRLGRLPLNDMRLYRGKHWPF